MLIETDPQLEVLKSTLKAIQTAHKKQCETPEFCAFDESIISFCMRTLNIPFEAKTLSAIHAFLSELGGECKKVSLSKAFKSEKYYFINDDDE